MPSAPKVKKQAVSTLTAGTTPSSASRTPKQNARQLSAAPRARDALAEAIRARQDGFGLDAAAVCLTDALQALCDLTGEDATAATIDEVFETFCVGK